MPEAKQVILKESVYSPDQIVPNSLPKIVFTGRSNVGKSSLINSLLHRSQLARTSSRPGKTVGIFYYWVNELFYFVDLPGYGYARLDAGEKKRIQHLMQAFFEKSRQIRLICFLLDCRREISSSDSEILELFLQKNFPILTILTKGDKLSFSKLRNRQNYLKQQFGLKTVPFSSKSKIGRTEIWEYVCKALKE